MPETIRMGMGLLGIRTVEMPASGQGAQEETRLRHRQAARPRVERRERLRGRGAARFIDGAHNTISRARKPYSDALASAAGRLRRSNAIRSRSTAPMPKATPK